MSADHLICRVVRVSHEDGYRLGVGFDDGSEQQIDFEPILRGEIFGELRDLQKFSAVKINRESGTLEWPNGADLDPETLHDWPVQGPKLARQLERAESILREEPPKRDGS